MYMSFRKGQFSTYLKPIIVVILAVLLVALLTSTLKFGGETQKERAQYEFDSQAPKIKNKILKCLSVSENRSTSGALINYSKLRKWNRRYKFQEPKCAEDFKYGWNATITTKYIDTEGLKSREQVLKPIAFIPGEGDKVENYLEAHNYSKEIISWNNFTDLRLFEYGAIIVGSPQDINQSSKKEKAKEKIKEYVEEGGTLITTGKSWKTIDYVWPGKLKKKKVDGGHVCFKPTTQGAKVLNITKTHFSAWMESGTPILKKDSNDVLELSRLQKSCPSLEGTMKCSGDPVGTDNSSSMLAFKYGRGFVMNSIFHFDDQLGCGLNDSDILNKIIDRKEIYHAISGGDSSCVITPRRDYGGSVDIAFIVDRSSSMQSPNMCSNIQSIVGELESVGINVRYTVYGLPEGPDVGSWASDKGVQYSGQLNQKHFTTKTTVDYPCVEKKTKWRDNIAFHPLKDAKSEAWGPGVLHALDDYLWRPYSEKLVVVLGDQDPTGGCNGRMWLTMGCKNSDCQPYSASADLAGQRVNSDTQSESSYSLENSEEKRTMSLCTNCERDWHCGAVPFYFANPWRKEPGKKCKGSSGGKLDSEVEVMDEVINEAFAEDASVYFLERREYILTEEYKTGSPSEEDYLEAMEKVAEESEGRVFPFRRWARIVDILKDKLRTIKVEKDIEPCPDVDFTFGERGVENRTARERGATSGSSMGVSLGGKAVYTYPARVMQSEEIRVPARIELEVRQGDLETLSGAINKVYALGKRRGTDFSQTFQFNLDSEAFIDDVEFKRIAETRYTLSGGLEPSNKITVDEDFRIGVNGVEKFEDDDQMHTGQPNANYKGYPINFNASLGESFQVIARNVNPPRMKLGNLYLHCCGGKTQKVADEIIVNNHTNPERYKEKGIVFFHNFTTIDIGEMESYTEKGICIRPGSEKACVDLKPDDINDLTLSPGKHQIKIKYSTLEDSIEVIK